MDVALTAAALAAGALLMFENTQWEGAAVSWVAVPALLPFALTVLWRNVRPLAVAVAGLVLVTAHTLAFGSLVRCGIVFPVTWLVAFAAGARLDRGASRAALGLVLATQLVMSLGDAVLGPEVMVLFGPITWADWLLGRVVRNRAELVEELRARTAELREARDERARLEVATDRARLSGELDRLLQRRLGELEALADDGAEAAAPEEARRLLVRIETASRDTLEQMRAVVGVLRHEDGVPTAPQPTLTHLAPLLAGHARLRVEGSPRVLPAGLELSAYRVVEHLLAALDDAGEVDVVVRFGDDALELVVAGPPRRRAEAALERARERVELHRGTLVAHTDAGRSEAIAHLPVLAGA